MNDELFELRRSPNHDEFVQRRDHFEVKWFKGTGLPRWYINLYRYEHELVVE